MKTETITTYDKTEAERAEEAMNAHRKRLGFGPAYVRSFQKAGDDGKPDCYTIRLQDGAPVDITRDFAPSFG